MKKEKAINISNNDKTKTNIGDARNILKSERCIMHKTARLDQDESNVSETKRGPARFLVKSCSIIHGPVIGNSAPEEPIGDRPRLFGISTRVKSFAVELVAGLGNPV